MYFKWNGKKIGWYGQEFSQSFLLTANFLCLQVPPFLLLPVQNLEKKGNCWHHFSHKSVEIEGIQEEQDFLLTHQGGKTDDLVKWNLLSTFHVRNTSWHLMVSDTINLCAWGWGEHSGAVHVFRPAALQSHTDAPYGSAGFGGHLLKPASFSCADFSTWGKSWFPWLVFFPN